MNVKEAATIFTALSQETRLEVYKILVQNSLAGICPCEIAKMLSIPRNTLSFHLSLLLQAGLVTAEKKGKMLFYRPNCSKIRETTAFLHRDCVVCHHDEKSDHDEENIHQ